MTVAELIELLKVMPQHFTVLYEFHRDFTALRGDEIKVVPKERKEVVFRNGNYTGYDQYAWYKEEVPVLPMWLYSQETSHEILSLPRSSLLRNAP